MPLQCFGCWFYKLWDLLERQNRVREIPNQKKNRLNWYHQMKLFKPNAAPIFQRRWKIQLKMRITIQIYRTKLEQIN